VRFFQKLFARPFFLFFVADLCPLVCTSRHPYRLSIGITYLLASPK
jgi:hypothetical protein